MIRFGLAVAVRAWAHASIATAETIRLGGSLFWNGESRAFTSLERPVVILNDIEWISDAFSSDPALSRTEILLGELGTTQPPTGQLKSRLDWLELVDLETTDPAFLSEQFDLYAPRSGSLSELVYVPKVHAASYHVSCTLKDDMNGFSFCLVSSDYPPDRGVRIRTRLYLPPSFLEEPDLFHDVATGALAFVKCLDITASENRVHDQQQILDACVF